MFKNKQILALSVYMLLFMVAAGCKSKFEKLRASNDVAKKNQEGNRLYNKGDYAKALILFEDLMQRYKGQEAAQDLHFTYANTHYKLRDYTTARYQFKTFAETYPSSPKAEEARYMAAYCYYLESPSFSLDQENTMKAIEALQLFINLYPRSERVTEASKLIQDLRNKLEEKSYANAKLYLDIGDYQSAVIAFKNSLRDFPDTKYAEEMEFLAIKAQNLYARNSFEYKQEERYTEALTLYTEFAEKYPGSKYMKEAELIKTDSERGITEVKKLLATIEGQQKMQRELEKRKLQDSTIIKN